MIVCTKEEVVGSGSGTPGPAGPRGFTGSVGPAGPTGPAGPAGSGGGAGGGDVTLVGVQTLTNKTLAGFVLSGAEVITANAMGALVVDVTKPLNTKSITANSAFTFSATPATANTRTELKITNNAVAHTVTIPSSYSSALNALRTSIPIAASETLYLDFYWSGARWEVYGDPVATTGTGSYLRSSAGVQVWVSGSNYFTNDVVATQTGFYKALSDIIGGTSDPSSVPVLWQLVAAIDGTATALGIGGISYALKSATSGGTWGTRDGATGFARKNGSTWEYFLCGGWNGSASDANWSGNGGGIVTNQVYKTTDGITYTRVRDHDLTPDSTHFNPSHTMANCMHNVGGTEYMYLFGGDIYDPHSEVRRSTDGVTWTRVDSPTPGWNGLVLASAGSLNGNLYITAGLVSPYNVANHKNETWKSTDNGVTWTSLGNAGYPARATAGSLVNFNNRLWLIAGGKYDANPLNRVYYNDSWSMGTDEIWVQKLADGHSQFLGRQYACTFALNSWMYIYKGANPNGNLFFAFRSQDGAAWHKVILDGKGSHADGCAAGDTGVLFATGNGWVTLDNTNTPTYFLSAVTSGELASDIVESIRTEVARIQTEPLLSILLGSTYTSRLEVDQNTAQTELHNYYPAGDANYGGIEFYTGVGGVQTKVAAINGLGSFVGTSFYVTGNGSVDGILTIGPNAGFNASLEVDQGNAQVEFHNPYPGTFEYGGYDFYAQLGGVQTKVAGVDGTGLMFGTGLRIVGSVATINAKNIVTEASATIGVKSVNITAFDYTVDVTVGDGAAYFVIPSSMNGMNLISAHAYAITAGVTGTTDIQIARIRSGTPVDMLSTKITIESTQTGSNTAAAQHVIDTANDDVATHDRIRVDVDATSTTKAKGAIIVLNFQLP